MEHAMTQPGRATNTRKMPGHWVLARLGKRVLRPGGWELTERMLDALDIRASDTVVEFAPGMGATARVTLARNPASYVAVERDRNAAEGLVRLVSGEGRRLHHGTAENTGLPDASASVVYGEAMLSMQPEEIKRRIVREAVRLLSPGGRYAIHELSLLPDDISAERRREIEEDLTQTVRVGVRPLTVGEWRQLLEAEGLHVEREERAPMHLLEPSRILRDEGIARTARIVWNALWDTEARHRALGMRRAFRRYDRHLGAVAFIATKPK